MTAAEQACVFLLDRAMKDANLAHLMGPGTKAFDFLCAGAAESLGISVKAVRARYTRSTPFLEPAEVDVLRSRVEALCARVLEYERAAAYAPYAAAMPKVGGDR